MIVIIHGAMGTGKTFHKAAFARHFRCAKIVDGWDPLAHELPQDGRLVLTSAHLSLIRQVVRMDRPDCDVRIIDIVTARQAIGADPHAPHIAERLGR